MKKSVKLFSLFLLLAFFLFLSIVSMAKDVSATTCTSGQTTSYTGCSGTYTVSSAYCTANSAYCLQNPSNSPTCNNAYYAPTFCSGLSQSSCQASYYDTCGGSTTTVGNEPCYSFSGPNCPAGCFSRTSNPCSWISGTASCSVFSSPTSCNAQSGCTSLYSCSCPTSTAISQVGTVYSSCTGGTSNVLAGYACFGTTTVGGTCSGTWIINQPPDPQQTGSCSGMDYPSCLGYQKYGCTWTNASCSTVPQSSCSPGNTPGCYWDSYNYSCSSLSQSQCTSTNGCTQVYSPSYQCVWNTVPSTPSAPTLASSMGVNGQPGISVSWNSISSSYYQNNGSYYKIQRSQSGTINYQILSSSLSNTFYWDGSLAPSTLYSYEIQNCNKYGCSPWSASASVTTLPPFCPGGDSGTLDTQNAGCRVPPVSYATNISSTPYYCDGGKTCYQCNSGYTWNGTTCVYGAPSCPAPGSYGEYQTGSVASYSVFGCSTQGVSNAFGLSTYSGSYDCSSQGGGTCYGCNFNYSYGYNGVNYACMPNCNSKIGTSYVGCLNTTAPSNSGTNSSASCPNPYSQGYKCYSCNSGYVWNGSACAQPSLYFADNNYKSVSSITSNTLPKDLYLYVQNYASGGTFTLYEKNYSCGFLACSFYNNVNLGTFSGGVSGSDTVSSNTWTLNSNVLNNPAITSNSGTYNFFFTLGSYTSPTLSVTSSQGDRYYQCGSNNLCGQVTSCSGSGCYINDPSCGGQCSPAPVNKSQCASVSFCTDYTSANVGSNAQSWCSADVNGVGGCNVSLATYLVDYGSNPPAGVSAFCSWNSAAGACGLGTSGGSAAQGTGASCQITQNPVSEDCSNSQFVNSSWTSQIVWENNTYSALGSCQKVCSGVGTCESDGSNYHCLPNGFSCESGSAVIPCPAEVQLSFFDWQNAIVAVLIIFVLYVILWGSRKRKVSPAKRRLVKRK